MRHPERKFQHDDEDREVLPLATAAQHTLEEARMVLPGLQALFGFQLTAVFSAGFPVRLAPREQAIHFAATALVAVSIALIMTPAAFDRQSGPRVVTDSFVRLASRLIVWAMVPLPLALPAEFYVMGRAIGAGWVAAASAGALLAIFVTLWFVLPRARRLRRLLTGPGETPPAGPATPARSPAAPAARSRRRRPESRPPRASP